MNDEHKEADERMAQRAKDSMRSTIWSYLNLTMGKELAADDLDGLTWVFINAGLQAVANQHEVGA